MNTGSLALLTMLSLGSEFWATSNDPGILILDVRLRRQLFYDSKQQWRNILRNVQFRTRNVEIIFEIR